MHEVGQNHRLVEGLFDIQNKGGMRQEIEIALEKLNGEPFRGTISPLEAKYGIYAECLGFPDFGNFEGFRFGHKGVPVITLILKSAINVDELLPVQYFDYHRKSSGREDLTPTSFPAKSVGCETILDLDLDHTRLHMESTLANRMMVLGPSVLKDANIECQKKRS